MKTILSIEALDKIYPIGAIYISSDKINPSCIIGGIWENYNDCEYSFIRVG